ncbi:hypothetical protein IU397_02655 [Actibacterium sp. 188UL27-1]|nr:hypothetical protein [Actibacterium sp. 188UL27-1]
MLLSAIGMVGFSLYVLNYTMLTARRISADQPLYFIINLSAASFVLIGLLNAFNLAAALIQVFWICVSLVGFAMRTKSEGTSRKTLRTL